MLADFRIRGIWHQMEFKFSSNDNEVSKTDPNVTKKTGEEMSLMLHFHSPEKRCGRKKISTKFFHLNDKKS